MRFLLSADQRTFSDAVGDMFGGVYSRAALRAFINESRADPAGLAALAEFGALGVCATSEVGGLDLGATDALPVFMASGANLVPCPVAELVISTAMLSRDCPDVAARIVSGQDLSTLAWQADLTARDEDGWTLTGRIDPVAWGGACRWLIVPASVADRAESERLFAVDLDDPGAAVTVGRGLDLTYPPARITLIAAHARELTAAQATVERFRHLYTIAVAAELVGAAERCLSMATRYMGERRQFGQVIGSFQALKHMAADDAVRLESMRLAVLYAAASFDADRSDVAMATSVAASFTADAARKIVEDSIQIHGAIAYTWEFDLHLYYRRILRCAVTAGTAEDHREAIAAALVNDGVASHPAKAA